MNFTWKNKRIGTYKDGEFHKKVNPEKHFMRKYQGYGIDWNIISELPRETKVFIHAPGKTYETTIATYQDEGIQDDLGYGKQIFLPTKQFL